jgi:NTP pyrophosphatase (non-canonical NTP hydrolase)
LILGNSVRKTEQPSAEDIRALELLVASITLSKEEDTNSYLYRNYSEFVNKHYKQTQNLNFDFLHVACGIGGEAGEIIDALKKHAVYGKQLDVENVVEEIGDILFYIVALCNLIGTNLEAAIIANIAKLRKRYPEGAYSDQAAINRADKP